jgi:hypothetical protein
MIKKTVRTRRLGEYSEIRENLEYWLSRPPGERIEAVCELSREQYGSARLQRVARLIKLKDK